MHITLTTDFGTQDAFAGILKGVIACINPGAAVVDITHEIPPFDVQSAAWILAQSFSFFPPGTVHVAVVDPGVGSLRRGIVLAGREHMFVGPDNGIFSLLPGMREMEAFELTCSSYFRRPVSDTFHGRDIFAPVAAHLSLGVSAGKMGPRLDSRDLVVLPVPPLHRRGDSVVGMVVHVDRFGNLITNIPGTLARQAIGCLVADSRLAIVSTYSNACQCCALVGSHGFLEIGVYQARADKAMSAGPGTEVILLLGDEKEPAPQPA